MPVPVLAHVGHLLVDVPLFFGPVVLLAGALALHARHVRRSDPGDTADPDR